ncbi:hypothetical protein T02_11969 [Trichinella nativa]|uniref:Uncharacterized protein n=1 Tax=Trichinella nativa TaxID=6335 RepID=A0A0V1LS17_9BILA|nr:hypothetical protein T02_11969 [Trichinella nativa]
MHLRRCPSRDTFACTSGFDILIMGYMKRYTHACILPDVSLLDLDILHLAKCSLYIISSSQWWFIDCVLGGVWLDPTPSVLKVETYAIETCHWRKIELVTKNTNIHHIMRSVCVCWLVVVCFELVFKCNTCIVLTASLNFLHIISTLALYNYVASWMAFGKMNIRKWNDNAKPFSIQASSTLANNSFQWREFTLGQQQFQ